MTRFPLMTSLLVGALALSPLGCDEHDHNNENNHDHDNNHDNNDHDGEAHVCVHFKEGPNATVTAATTATETLSESFEEHTKINVTLPDGATEGYIQWTPEEAGEFAFWLDADVPFALFDGETEVAPEETGGGAKGCEDLAVAHKEFDVEEKTYTIRIGAPTTGATVGFVAEHGEHSD